jgi:hypothetical protein
MLRKTILVFGLSFVLSLSSLSQPIRGYGFKLGAVLANQTFEYHDLEFPIDPEREDRWGFDLGMYLELMNAPAASILAEIHYIQKGYGLTVAETGPDGPEILGYTTLDWRYDYLTVPILFKLRYQSESLTPYLIAGPRIDILLGEFEPSYVLPIDYESVDFGVSMGLGTEILLGSIPRSYVEFRYSPNLTTAYKGAYVDIKNRSFEFLLGIEI